MTESAVVRIPAHLYSCRTARQPRVDHALDRRGAAAVLIQQELGRLLLAL